MTHRVAVEPDNGYFCIETVLETAYRICFEMIKKLFEVEFLHFLPESSGQIVTAIFLESSVEPEVFSSQTF
mgnify:FL=1